MLKKDPKVSFIIPVLNRERKIDSCLESIAKQRYDNKEIIIVDGGSKDRTVEIASQYTTKIIVDHGPLGQARRFGVDKSSGEVLGIFDSDIVIPDQDWLNKAVQTLYRQANAGILWPIQIHPKNASLVARCYSSFWKERVKITKDALPGGNSLILRRAYEDAGGFNPSVDFGEDFDLAHRIIEKGYSVITFPHPIIHDTMSSLREFARKQMWGASSLLGKKRRNVDARLASMCISWKMNEKNQSKTDLVKTALSSHFLVAFAAILDGVVNERDYSILLLPLLLAIRIAIYSIFFIA